MGAFASIFKTLLGGDPVAGISQIIDQFHISPDEKAKLQNEVQALANQKEAMELARDEAFAELAQKDMESARARQIAVRDRVVGFLAIAVTLGFFGCLALMYFRTIPQTNSQLLYTTTGVLGTAWIMVMGYYFGSSVGSATKTDVLAKQLEQKN